MCSIARHSHAAEIEHEKDKEPPYFYYDMKNELINLFLPKKKTKPF